jgi:hypothetical protein
MIRIYVVLANTELIGVYASREQAERESREVYGARVIDSVIERNMEPVSA